MGGLHIDFKCRKDDNRGIYYGETKRALIYLGMHESLADVFKTINHEVYHHCFAELGEAENMDEDQEEAMIFNLAWGEYLA